MKNNFNCFQKNGNMNIINYFYETLLNPYYLTNISIILTIIFCLSKNYFLIHSIMPLLIANGISILVQYAINHFNKTITSYKKENVKYICNSNNKDQKYILKNFNKSKNIITTIFYSLIVHFWLPILIIGYGRSAKYGDPNFIDRSHSNFMGSLFVCLIIILSYGLYFRKDQYIIAGIDEKKMVSFICKVFGPILLLTIYFYFLK